MTPAHRKAISEGLKRYHAGKKKPGSALSEYRKQANKIAGKKVVKESRSKPNHMGAVTIVTTFSDGSTRVRLGTAKRKR